MPFQIYWHPDPVKRFWELGICILKICPVTIYWERDTATFGNPKSDLCSCHFLFKFSLRSVQFFIIFLSKILECFKKDQWKPTAQNIHDFTEAISALGCCCVLATCYAQSVPVLTNLCSWADAENQNCVNSWRIARISGQKQNRSCAAEAYRSLIKGRKINTVI